MIYWLAVDSSLGVEWDVMEDGHQELGLTGREKVLSLVIYTMTKTTARLTHSLHVLITLKVKSTSHVIRVKNSLLLLVLENAPMEWTTSHQSLMVNPPTLSVEKMTL